MRSRFREVLQSAGSGSQKPIKKPDRRAVEERDHAHTSFAHGRRSPRTLHRRQLTKGQFIWAQTGQFCWAPRERATLLDSAKPTIVRIHSTANAVLQNAFSSFVLYSLYKDMFRRGVQTSLTHAIIFDEAHRAARLKLIPQLAKECRKFGLALVLASQEAKDFSTSLFSAVGNYLALRVTEADARTLARMTGPTADEKHTADRLKALVRYTGVFFGEGRARPVTVRLGSDNGTTSGGQSP